MWLTPVGKCLAAVDKSILPNKKRLIANDFCLFPGSESPAPIVGRGVRSGADLAPVGLCFDNSSFELLVLHQNLN